MFGRLFYGTCLDLSSCVESIEHQVKKSILTIGILFLILKKIFTLFLIELYIYLKHSSCLILNKIQFWGSVHQKEKKGTFIGWLYCPSVCLSFCKTLSLKKEWKYQVKNFIKYHGVESLNGVKNSSF